MAQTAVKKPTYRIVEITRPGRWRIAALLFAATTIGSSVLALHYARGKNWADAVPLAPIATGTSRNSERTAPIRAARRTLVLIVRLPWGRKRLL